MTHLTRNIEKYRNCEITYYYDFYYNQYYSYSRFNNQRISDNEDYGKSDITECIAREKELIDDFLDTPITYEKLCNLISLNVEIMGGAYAKIQKDTLKTFLPLLKED